MRCRICDGEGQVCDHCERGGLPIRLVEGEELCQECAEELANEMENENG